MAQESVKEDVSKSEDKNDEYLLDMVFVLDCTGSMASYINSARDNIVKISQQLSKLSEKQEEIQENASKKKNENEMNENKEQEKESNEKKEKEKENDNVKKDEAKLEEQEGAQIEGMPDTNNNNNNNNNNNKDSKSELKNPEPKKKLSCKFAVVAYRDHPPQDSTFITQIRDFTGSSVMIEQYLKTLSATGGGDGPECLTTALYDTLHNLKYRENSQKIIIVITDAPCHGLEDTSYTSDGFPNGDPWPQWKLSTKKSRNNKNQSINFGIKTRSKESSEEEENYASKTMTDILEIARDITDNLQASFYTVACEPCLSTYYDYARDLMEAMAEMSNGKYLPLAKANLLPKVIIGSVKQQMLIDELSQEIDKEIEELKEEYNKKNEKLTQDIIESFMEKKWENANLTYKEVAIGTLYRKERKRDNIEFLLNRQECKTLKDFAKHRIKLERLTQNDFRHLKGDKSCKVRLEAVRNECAWRDELDDDDIMNEIAEVAEMDARFKDVSSIVSDLREECDMHDAMLDELVELSDDLSSSSKMFAKKSKSKSMGFSFGSMLDGISSLFSSSNDKDSDIAGDKPVARSQASVAHMASMTASLTPAAAAAPRGAKKKSKSKKSSDDMALSMRWGDDNDANLSCSEDEQEVYEQVRPMDSKGVKKAVSRYMQTYY